MSSTRGEILDFANAATLAARTDLDIAEMEPEFARFRILESNGDCHRVFAIVRLLHEADDFAIIDLGEAQATCLLQCTVATANAM